MNSAVSSIIAGCIASRLKPAYRGEIWEFISRAPMGKGHGNDNQPFNIESARYLKPVFQAIRSDLARKIVLKSGVKTMKTFAVEAALAYFCAHGTGDIGFYLADIARAKDHAKSRFWDWFWGIEDLAAMRLGLQSRFDDTTTGVYFPGKTFRVWPLNESSVQAVNLSVVALSDAFLAGTTGLISQMIHRTDQYKAVRKILIESQGGIEGDDFDMQWLDTNQAMLNVVCPLCHQSQPFSWERKRKDDFTPSPPITVPSLDHAAWIEHNRTLLLEEDRRHSGMKRGDQSAVKDAEGDYNESEVKRLTHYECYHCGGTWKDDGEFGPTRVWLDQSAHYVPERPNALPGNLGFSWPQWANRRIQWGDNMLDYLLSKKLQRTRGNTEDLKQWYQKVAGQTWDPKLATELRRRFQADYDVKLSQHDAWRLLMVVDNQLDLAQQWVMVLAAKQNGSVRQIWRGPLLGLKACREKQMEYGKDARGNPILKDQFVFLDGRYRPEEICRHIVEQKYGHWAKMDGRTRWVAWNLMQGGRNEYYTHSGEKDPSLKFVVGDERVRPFQVDGRYVEVLVFPFAATACGERFESSRDGKGSETLFLPRQEGEPPDEHPLSHYSQIHSNKLVASGSVEPRAARMKYIPVPASAPDHYFHMWRMTEAVKELWGIDGVYRKTSGEVAATDAPVG